MTQNFRALQNNMDEATLAGYELLQTLYKQGGLDAVRATVGGGSKFIEQAVEVASGPEAIRATRNILLLVKTLSDIDPTLLSDMTRTVPDALVQANAEEARPAGLIKLISTFLNRDFRRGLAAFNDLLIVLGKNLTVSNSRREASRQTGLPWFASRFPSSRSSHPSLSNPNEGDLLELDYTNVSPNSVKARSKSFAQSVERTKSFFRG